MGRRKRILVVSPLKSGGVERFFVNMLEILKKDTEFTFHFAVPYSKEEKQFYEAKILELGAEIIKLGGNSNSRSISQIIKKRVRLQNILKKGHYDVLHINVGGNGASTSYIDAIMSNREYVGKIIVHCHTSELTAMENLMRTKMRAMLHNVFRNKWIMSDKYVYLACSKDAAEWCFPEVVNRGKWQMLPYGIDIDKFKYSEEFRQIMRNKYGITDDTIVILNVARFSIQKNHAFMLRIVEQLLTEMANIRMVFVGEGELKEPIRNKCKRMKIDSKVIFADAAYDICHFYSMADMFLFPSKWEGLGIVAIEAQTNGLPVLMSTEVPREAVLNTNCFCLGLDEDVTVWTDKVKECVSIGRIQDGEVEVVLKGFDVRSTVSRMKEIYMTEGQYEDK